MPQLHLMLFRVGECADREWDNEKDGFFVVPGFISVGCSVSDILPQVKHDDAFVYIGISSLLFTGVSARFLYALCTKKPRQQAPKWVPDIRRLFAAGIYRSFLCAYPAPRRYAGRVEGGGEMHSPARHAGGGEMHSAARYPEADETLKQE